MPHTGWVDHAAEPPAERRSRPRRAAARHHRVVQPVRRGEPLAGHDEAERLGVARGERAADGVDRARAPPRRGAPARCGAERLVPDERHERERPRADRRPRGMSGSTSAMRRLDVRVVARPEARGARRGEAAPGASASPLRSHRDGGDHVDAELARRAARRRCEMPRLAASSAMLSASTNGTPASASWRREQEAAAEVLRVADLERDVAALDEQDVARHLLVLGHREQVVRPRRVHHVPGLAVDGRPSRGSPRRSCPGSSRR